jgi:U4/U6.U5 tri-snRNP-associated protein 2
MKRERDGEGEEPATTKLQKSSEESTSCPYLGTIDRTRLDFDFEKVCSVSMQSTNVYACLVCGKYFQGRGKNSQAYTHSLQAGHHVFLNLGSKRFYCLPDGYEVIDSSLEDITGVLDPAYPDEALLNLDQVSPKCRTLDGQVYLLTLILLTILVLHPRRDWSQ